jgi:hypothetical protein
VVSREDAVGRQDGVGREAPVSASDRYAEVDAHESVRGAYRRALLGSLRRRSDPDGVELPAGRLVLRGAEIAVDRLAAYDRVCGFRLSDAIPVTYPQVLAFPLAMRLMLAADFPFPVIGLVHVANRITQARPIHVSERLDFTVGADALRPHARGRQFDVVATATVDGVEVWHGVSTYLKADHRISERRRDRGATAQPADDAPRARRTTRAAGAAGPPADTAPSSPNAPSSPDALSSPNALWSVGRKTGRAYATVSGDRNPIHVSRVGARMLGFRRPIAHGMWTMARAVAALEGRLGETYTIDVAFRRPVPLPSTLAWHASRDRDGWTISVADAKSGKAALTGSIAPA